jgi:hypothetical protein
MRNDFLPYDMIKNCAFSACMTTPFLVYELAPYLFNNYFYRDRLARWIFFISTSSMCADGFQRFSIANCRDFETDLQSLLSGQLICKSTDSGNSFSSLSCNPQNVQVVEKCPFHTYLRFHVNHYILGLRACPNRTCDRKPETLSTTLRNNILKSSLGTRTPSHHHNV